MAVDKRDESYMQLPALMRMEPLSFQYVLGNLTPEQVRGYAPRWITGDQAEQIVGGVDHTDAAETE